MEGGVEGRVRNPRSGCGKTSRPILRRRCRRYEKPVPEKIILTPRRVRFLLPIVLIMEKVRLETAAMTLALAFCVWR